MAPSMPTESELVELEARRGELRDRYLLPPGERDTPGRGIHHAALICSDVEQTIQFYQGLLGFPLVELVENRDYHGSSHFFFDRQYTTPFSSPCMRADSRTTCRTTSAATGSPLPGATVTTR